MTETKLLTQDDLIIKERLSKPKIPRDEIHFQRRREKLLGDSRFQNS